jgi:hypothetical protein
VQGPIYQFGKKPLDVALAIEVRGEADRVLAQSRRPPPTYTVECRGQVCRFSTETIEVKDLWAQLR